MNSTGNFTPDYIRHTYKVTNELKSYTVYELSTSEGNVNLLTDILRIEQFQGKSNASNISDYLRLRNTTNWSKCAMITGLRTTTKEGVFYGDWLRLNKSLTTKKTLLVFTFYKDEQTLLIDVYRDFYPHNNVLLQNIICTY
ncbi:hypothetical protein [Flavobacterium sp. K5-23]|jgi:hypothetical protein|uniref:hypothetical protein n=1 Tax=Flavobacterium sp. K5-23 TaxID=2746225 RepID=UPI002010AF56|nr:hypothetical protein [Flavobacterium sp. K5-23]UQD55867.1 hypothetical protein FLAK523_05430 [Flavobacterium sp. K5-23]